MPVQEGENYYDVLGVEADVTPEALKLKYRRLARELHPDVHPGDAAVAERFKAVSRAYATLSDETLRAAYDLANGIERPVRANPGERGWDDIEKRIRDLGLYGEDEPTVDTAPSPAPPKEPEPQPEPASETPTSGTFASEPLRPEPSADARPPLLKRLAATWMRPRPLLVDTSLQDAPGQDVEHSLADDFEAAYQEAERERVASGGGIDVFAEPRVHLPRSWEHDAGPMAPWVNNAASLLLRMDGAENDIAMAAKIFCFQTPELSQQGVKTRQLQALRNVGLLDGLTEGSAKHLLQAARHEAMVRLLENGSIRLADMADSTRFRRMPLDDVLDEIERDGTKYVSTFRLYNHGRQEAPTSSATMQRSAEIAFPPTGGTDSRQLDHVVEELTETYRTTSLRAEGAALNFGVDPPRTLLARKMVITNAFTGFEFHVPEAWGGDEALRPLLHEAILTRLVSQLLPDPRFAREAADAMHRVQEVLNGHDVSTSTQIALR